MPSWGYSIIGLDPEKTAIASGRDLRIKPKAAREICNFIKGMKLAKARETLQKVIDLKQPVPYYRYRLKVPHRKEAQGYDAGRYPQKAANEILRVLNAVEANAGFKGLNTDDLKIIHISASKGRVIKKFIPRAMGRASPYNKHLTHIEIAVEEG
jgi:large subunit ribosomal protein L22